jgi:uncharacterized oxidoreductase
VKGFTVLLSGGSAGLGLELARLLAADNRVIVFGRSLAVAEREPFEYVNADVTDLDSLRRLHDTLRQRGIAIDVLINNAGVFDSGDVFKPGALEASARVIATNITGPVNLLSVFADDLTRSAQGTVVNMSSVLAYAPAGFCPVYSGSKAFLSAFSKSLRAAGEAHGLRVVEVVLPMLDTAMTRAIRIEGLNKLAPAAAAQQIVQQLKTGAAQIRIGEAGIVMKLLRLIPARIQARFDAISQQYLKDQPQ